MLAVQFVEFGFFLEGGGEGIQDGRQWVVYVCTYGGFDERGRASTYYKCGLGDSSRMANCLLVVAPPGRVGHLLAHRHRLPACLRSMRVLFFLFVPSSTS